MNEIQQVSNAGAGISQEEECVEDIHEKYQDNWGWVVTASIEARRFEPRFTRLPRTEADSRELWYSPGTRRPTRAHQPQWEPRCGGPAGS